MATYTAGDQINRALRLLGVLAEGETPSASESADALMALNQMLDSWSTESLAVFATLEQTFTWPAGQATRTLGPSGNLVGERPVVLDPSSYIVVNGITYPLQVINQEQYNGIPVKTIQANIPGFVHVNPTFPDAEITLFPVPSEPVEIHFVSSETLSQPALLTTILSFPPGYLRAFTYNLALELAPEFGVEPSKDVRRIAMTSKRNLKRINDPADLLDMPFNLPANGRYNIRGDFFR